MAVTPASRAPAGLDPAVLRRDFPIFERLIHGHPLAYLDSASTAQKPRAVLDAVQHLYTHSYANVHRGVYTLSVEATEQYEGARDKVAALIGAPSRRECVFVRDTTEGLNLVAYAYGRDRVGPGDVIVATEMEHHSNLVPWQLLASKTGAKLRYLPLTPEGRLDLDALERFATEGPLRIVAAVHQSNSLGTLNPIPELAERAHALGAVLVVDGAQSVPHRAVDVHRARLSTSSPSPATRCAVPPGPALLWGREELLADMDPFITGGEMIGNVTLERTSLERAALEVRGRARPPSPSASASARRSTTSRPSASTPSSATSTSSRPTPTTGSPPCRGFASSARGPRPAAGSCPSPSPGSTRTTWPRSWTRWASACAPATTARSRRWRPSASRRPRGPASTSTPRATRSTGSPTGSSASARSFA